MSDSGIAGTDWTKPELELTVESYFTMLKLELAGSSYNKAARNQALLSELPGRSRGAIEFKHQNISAVLLENGWPFIQGYKPAKNYQNALRYAVEIELRRDPEIESLAAMAAAKSETDDVVIGTNPVLIQPPEVVLGVAQWQPRSAGVKRDYAYRDARNRKLGLAGEIAVVEFEMRRLRSIGEPKLASQVEHISVSLGDGLGYDVRSFERDGADRFIEVKTTIHPAETPFFVSANELAASEFYGSEFHLYRMFRFTTNTGLYVMTGALSVSCELKPVSYSATPKS